MTDIQLAETIDAISEADNVVASHDSLFRSIPQALIALVVVIVWGLTIFLIFSWTLGTGKGTDSFICNTPPAPGSSLGTDCTNGWIATRDQLKDVFTFGVLPFLTLVIGFYFGQKSSTAEALE